MPTENANVLAGFATQDGTPLEQLARDRPLLMIFLRHGGCPFCRQVLADLQAKRPAIEARGTRIALVHMMSDAEAASLFAKYGADDLPRISDPERRLYQQFELPRAGYWEIAGPPTWWSGLKATLSGNLPSKPRGDIFQLPGAFLIQDGKILRAFRPKSSGERAPLDDLATCPIG